MRLFKAMIFMASLTLAACGDPNYQEPEHQGKLHPPVQGTYSTGDIPYK